jgi:hypothetical protein
MRLQFEANHQFQLDAEAAVTDLFDGQPLSASGRENEGSLV